MYPFAFSGVSRPRAKSVAMAAAERCPIKQAKGARGRHERPPPFTHSECESSVIGHGASAASPAVIHPISKSVPRRDASRVKTQYRFAFFLSLLGIVFATGCTNTARGVKADTHNAAEHVENATH